MTDQQPLRALGVGGPLVTPLALGTMTFGAETDADGARAQLDAYVEAGGNHIDTADVYGADHASERIIGGWLADRGLAGDLVIATKGRFAPPAGSRGASRRSLVRSVEASLERLDVDAIDLYYVHGWDEHTPLEETLDALSAMVRAGLVHNIGWSNCTGWQLARIVTTAAAGGYVRPVAFQPQYNLLDRGIEWEVMPCALEAGLGLAAWSPLGGGWLTGKYRRDERPTGDSRLGDDPDRGVEAYDARNTERTWAILDVIERVAAAHARPWGHVAIAWAVARPGVSTVLLGARTTEQLEQNLEASTLELAPEELDALTAASAPGLPPYPYGMVEEYCDVPFWRRLATHTPTGAAR